MITSLCFDRNSRSSHMDLVKKLHLLELIVHFNTSQRLLHQALVFKLEWLYFTVLYFTSVDFFRFIQINSVFSILQFGGVYLHCRSENESSCLVTLTGSANGAAGETEDAESRRRFGHQQEDEHRNQPHTGPHRQGTRASFGNTRR